QARLRRDVWRTAGVSPVPQGTLEEIESRRAGDCRAVSPERGISMKQSSYQTPPPRAADTHPAPVSAACAPRPATPIAGRGSIQLPSLALALPDGPPIFIRGG